MDFVARYKKNLGQQKVNAVVRLRLAKSKLEFKVLHFNTHVTTMDTEIFEFFSLPNELIHQLMQFFEPVTLCRLSQCNHEFNELANADHLWQRLIPVYKGKIISVGVDVISK